MNDCRRSSYNRGQCHSMDEFSQFPLAMAYVPWQRFGQTYELSKAFTAGTIFPELNKPFSGKRGNCK
ncbi:MAG: spore coat associated protein CotJA [Lachnospiraceae bacterium]